LFAGRGRRMGAPRRRWVTGALAVRDAGDASR
jgi:hypothetical protein